MISLILPYWDRQEAADKALFQLWKTYAHMKDELEIVVVDDGNAVPFIWPTSAGYLNIKTVRLPKKSIPMCPTTAWNAGVAAATGDYIVLSCIEILHTKPVLQEMVEEAKRLGPLGYVLAAAWCPEYNAWHCHSTVEVPGLPGTGIAFCAAMHKSLYHKAGGFDEDYRDGAGYEDRDFIQRLKRVNARFVIRDDLVVIHPKSGATIQWQDGGFARNLELYHRKWPETETPVTIVALNANNYQGCGADYVNRLFDMVERNLPAGSYRFVCITDDPAGIDEKISTLPLPSDLAGWWGKLYMFKRGLFPDGARMIFFDLDTVITGPLDALVGYRGDFATLKDFYHPARVGPAVMAWKAGAVSSIWEEWESCGKKRNPMGDLWWINELDQGRFAKDVDKLQDLFPGMFVSFKANCNPYPPQGAKVVCFHGEPRPHNCGVEWVEQVRAIGGIGMPEIESICNTQNDIVKSNVISASHRALPWLKFSPVHDGQAVIVGGGPSLKRTIGEVSERAKSGQTIIAINNTAAFLSKHSIKTDIQIIIDARAENINFLAEAREYMLASQCDPTLFDALYGKTVTLFHMNTAGVDQILPDKTPLVSSGTTVGLAAMVVAYMMGYRKLHLHGFDSSYEDSHHVYAQKSNDDDVIVDVWAGGRQFKTTPWMVQQANQFQVIARELVQDDVIITVAGDGLLPHIARSMTWN